MTDWIAIIQRAAYTRFCRTGSLEPFRLKRGDLGDLVRQACGRPLPDSVDIVRLQVRVPVPQVGDGLMVMVDEWKEKGEP